MTARQQLDNPAPFDLDVIGAGLPVSNTIARLPELLQTSSTLVVQAPPGTGKTTLIPPTVANVVCNQAHPGHNRACPGCNRARPEYAGKVIVTAPRRVAVRAAARRLGYLDACSGKHATGTSSTLGSRVGYSIKGEHKNGDLVEFVTPGVLRRRLLSDPELDGVAAVIIDEVHERQLDTDLVLAMCIELAQLRDDFRLIAMSATLDATKFAELLGACPILATPAVTHPLDISYAPHPGRALCTGEFLDFLAEQAITAVESQNLSSGAAHSALVFVPGQREVDAVARRVEATSRIKVMRLHGGLASGEQDKALRDLDEPRIVVATSIAESSLTVPGVRIVVDSGLSRVPKRDSVRQMTGLVTVSAAQSTAEQRAGRAGREGPGTVIRAYSAADFANAAPHITPEILTSDLTDAALAMFCWGASADFPLSDAPSTSAFVDAVGTLHELGAVEGTAAAACGGHARAGGAGGGSGASGDGAGAGLASGAGAGAGLAKGDGAGAGNVTALLSDTRVTHCGRELAKLPVDPRLGRALLECGPSAATVIAVLADSPRGDIARLAEGGASGMDSKTMSTAVSHEARRLASLVQGSDIAANSQTAGVNTDCSSGQADSQGTVDAGFAGETDPGVITGLAFPQRIARRVGHTDEFLLAQGTRATLAPDMGLSDVRWLAIADVSRVQGRAGSSGAGGAGAKGAGVGARNGRGVGTKHTGGAGGVASNGAVIRAAARLSEQGALRILSVEETIEATIESGCLRGRRIRRAGAIELSSTPCEVPQHQAAEALAQHIARHGLSSLPAFTLSDHAAHLRDRVTFLHQQIGQPWPDLSELSAIDPMMWLGPELEEIATGVRAGSKNTVDMHAAIQRLLPWPEANSLDQLAPAYLEVPSGSRPKVDYGTGRPVVRVKLQECFGLAESPECVGVKVQFHLLSPAGRPLAVTDDLSSFWSGPYKGVRADMRGRYPKHPWPEDPWTAPATKKTKNRM